MNIIANKPTTTPLVERNRHPAGMAFNMLFGVCQVADGLVRIVSLGYLHTRLTSTAARKATEKLISRRKAAFEASQPRPPAEKPHAKVGY